MKSPTTTLANLIDSIRAAKRIILLMHISPDGDTCGSALALRRALVLAGKDICISCDQKAPAIFADLYGVETIVQPETLAGKAFDLAIAVDAADRLRVGRGIALFDAAKHTAQIDHHHTNPAYAEINYIRSPLSATGVLILEVIDALGVPMDLPMAKCLFVAVSTDTGNFKQQNTDPDALRLAARCLEAGLNPAEVTRRVFDVKPLAQVKLIARALQSLKTEADGQVSLMRLEKKDFVETGALPEHTEGIVNYGINTEGVRIGCLVAQYGEKIKASLRCLPPYNVSRIAVSLGGGGHDLAAGCTLEPPFDAACDRIEAKMIEELKLHA